MFKNVKDLDITDMKSLFPSFFIIVAMPLTYSISIGLSLGFLAYILLHLLTGDFKKINFTLLFIGALCYLTSLINRGFQENQLYTTIYRSTLFCKPNSVG